MRAWRNNRQQLTAGLRVDIALRPARPEPGGVLEVHSLPAQVLRAGDREKLLNE